jgi:magnesium transporter
MAVVPVATCTAYDGDAGPRPIAELSAISDVLADSNAFVWFDAIDPTEATLEVIREEFELHPLAIEDAIHEHRQPKIDSYGSYWFIVMHAATQAGRETTIHELALFAGKNFVVTVRASPAYPLDEITRRFETQAASLQRDSGALLYHILDTVVDGYANIAEFYELEVETMETALFAGKATTNDVLRSIFSMKKDVQRFRRAVAPMRDILAPIIRGDVALLENNELPYFRDVDDHTVRAIDQMDQARELVNNAIDLHISMGTNRQNEAAKQLSIIATVFLPLTFITGFFGQNFGYLVNHITSESSFWWLGIGSEIVGSLALLAYFRYKRWF